MTPLRRIAIATLLLWTASHTAAQTHVGAMLDLTQTFTGANTFASVNNVRNASLCTGADIFAQANACAAAIGGTGGVVELAPGVYPNVSTTLVGLSNVVFWARGVKVNYVGTSGCAMSFANTINAGIYGIVLLGPNAGTGTGLCLGNGIASTGQTLHNTFEDIEIGGDDQTVTTAGFFHGVTCTGNAGSGTYDNHFRNVHVYAALGTGWLFQPAANEYCNINVIDDGYAQHGAADGLLLDGAYGNVFNGFRSETNAGWGIELGTTQETDVNVFNGGWLESNTSGGVNCGSTHVNYNTMTGTNMGDIAGGGLSPQCNNAIGGGNTNGGNTFDIVNNTINANSQKYGWGWTYTVNANTPNGKPIFQLFNSDVPPSTLTQVFAWLRTSPNVGTLQIGTPEYPVIYSSKTQFASGLGAIQHIVGPPDQPLQIAAQSSENIQLTTSGGGIVTTASQIASTIATGTAPFTVASTTPVATLVVSNHPKVVNCSNTAACAANAEVSGFVVHGTVALTGGAKTVTALPFTGVLWTCVTSDNTTPGNGSNMVEASATTATVTGTGTDVIAYNCIGK